MQQISSRVALLIALGVFIVAGAGYGGYRYYVTAGELKQARGDIEAKAGEIETLTATLASTTAEKADLENQLADEKGRNDAFERKLDKVSGTVGTLEKLSKTDPQLLQKYSKVYFLNENYIPSKLADIPKKYLSDAARNIQFHADALPFLENMLDDAADDKIDIKVASVYRSFGTQASLKSSYTVTYGSGANKFSADQGYSEHQLGTAADFTASSLGGALAGFDKTPAYAWLTQNAYKYGFILSYPSGNAYYQFEPWHWRFVGVDLARRLHRDNLTFYDMDQREIDQYLVSIFD